MFDLKSSLKIKQKYSIFFIIVFIALTCTELSNAVTIMSVDFGSEWMKIAVVAPGIPMEIALNHESKRKTPVAISFRDGERTFGEEALSAGMKSPALSNAYLLDLLGKKIDNPMVQIYKERFPYYQIEADPERETVLFRYDSNTTYSVEELVAQVLNYARELATAYTNQKTKDIVITVPPFFNQAERRALLSAAELAGLKVLSLISTNAAVALNYGMFRRKEINETAQNILFYDMGASSTTATIASYQTIKTKDRGFSETNPQVSILGVGYDRTLGGLEMQLRLRDFLGKKFNEMKKTTSDVFKSPRGMAKLMKEAGKLKTVLSANTEHISQIEGLLDDQDFRLHVKREELEELCVDLFDRVQGPVDSALISAAIDIKDIHQFIIVGGSTRIPKIQAILQEIWGKELGKNINADEAAALGAVYRAADLGQGFKVMKFHVKESIVYPIEVTFERTIDKEKGSVASKTVKRSLFALANSYPQKKVMTFNKHTSDFGFNVNYGDLSHLLKEQIRSFGVSNISYVMVEGVTKAFKKNLAEGAEAKGIKAHFSMDDSGILDITGIEAVFDKNITVEADKKEESTLSKIGSTLSQLFSGNDGDSELNNSTEGAPENSTKEDNKDKDAKEDTKKTEQKELKPKLVTIKEELNFTINYLDLKRMSIESKKSSIEKLLKIQEVESTRKEKEKLKNTLESYILDVQDKLSQEDYEAASKEEDRNNIKDLALKLEDWLYEEGFDETPSVYKERLKSLETVFEPINIRVQEHRKRPEALKALQEMINVSSIFLNRAQNAPEREKWFTDIELKTLDELIINTQKWLEDKEEEQEKTSLSTDPVLTISSIAEKINAMDREINYLVNKGKLAKAKKEREEAEAKLKEAKAKVEKESKKKENDSSIQDEKAEGPEDSRQEPPLPTEEEEEEGSRVEEMQPEENEAEKNRRKDAEEEIVHEEM